MYSVEGQHYFILISLNFKKKKNWQDLPEESRTVRTVREKVNALGCGSGELLADALEMAEMVFGV